MSRRPSFRSTLPILVATVLAVAALSVSCGGGNPTGTCRKTYTDGEVQTWTTDKAYCEEQCAESFANFANIIASCYFAGSTASPTEP